MHKAEGDNMDGQESAESPKQIPKDLREQTCKYHPPLYYHWKLNRCAELQK